MFTIAKPEKTAPATNRRKNSSMPSRYYRSSKSIDTIVCTESTKE
jgi:hypothetical protein